MNFNIVRKKVLSNHTFNKWFGFGIIAFLLGITLYASNYVINELHDEEIKNVETIVIALEVLSEDDNINDKTREFALKIIEDNTKIPLILIDENGEFTFQRNLDKIEDQLINDTIFLNKKLKSMASEFDPIKVNLPFGSQKINFQNSFLLSQLKLYPFVLLFIIILFSFFSVWYFKTLETSRRGFLWAGMAKETAHQIGTPLSSLLGWVELLKMENLSEGIVVEEMEKDIKRLNQIANRFSKIGSEPELKKQDIVKACQETFNYLKLRVSSQVKFIINIPKEEIYAEFDKELLSWVLENVVKNAVDAMQNKGKLTLTLYSKSNEVYIKIKDTGTGLSSIERKNLFEPGFTTKKRGWGLGLTLAKRIIDDYHHGKIFVLKTSNKGTTIQINLPKIKPQNQGFYRKILNYFKP